jgi:hypothetical protein
MDEARGRAEASFRKEERAKDGAMAMTEYQANARLVREKTERLRALRLAKEAAEEAQISQSVRATRGRSVVRLRTILKVGYPTDLPRTQLPPRVIRHTDTARRVIGGLLPISILLSAMSERQQVPTVQSWARSRFIDQSGKSGGSLCSD